MLKKIFGSDPKRRNVVWSVVGLALWAGLVVIFFSEPDFYIWLATEDAFGENLTAIFYGVAGVLLLILPFRSSKRGWPLFRSFALSSLLAIFFIFVAGEEISWGQRLFNIDTPDSLVEKNVQHEFNIHNLEFFDRDSSILNQHTFLNLFILGFGVFIPLLNSSVAPARKFLSKISFPVVPLSFVIFFVVGLAHGQTVAKLYPHWAHTEIKELIFSIGVILFGVSFFLKSTNQKSQSEPPRV